MYNNWNPDFRDNTTPEYRNEIIKSELITESERSRRILDIIHGLEREIWQSQNDKRISDERLNEIQTKFSFYEEKFWKRVTTCTKCDWSWRWGEHFYNHNSNCSKCEWYKFTIKEDEHLINRFIKEFEDINKKQITEKQFLEIVYNQLRNYE